MIWHCYQVQFLPANYFEYLIEHIYKHKTDINDVKKIAEWTTSTQLSNGGSFKKVAKKRSYVKKIYTAKGGVNTPQNRPSVREQTSPSYNEHVDRIRKLLNSISPKSRKETLQHAKNANAKKANVKNVNVKNANVKNVNVNKRPSDLPKIKNAWT